jgi:calcineurin-like phosphoesterase family protein
MMGGFFWFVPSVLTTIFIEKLVAARVNLTVLITGNIAIVMDRRDLGECGPLRELRMSNIWFISDTHWGHANIIKYSNRPYADVQEMNEALIDNWNALVKPEDTVWHLGDFAFMSITEFKSVLRRLNGKINVVLGNHDKLITENRDELLTQGNIVSIQNYAEVQIGKKFLVLFHYGQRVWNKSHHNSIHLYGHSHGSLPPYGRSVDVGVDCKEITPEYRPINLEEIFKYMEKRSKKQVDHHGD